MVQSKLSVKNDPFNNWKLLEALMNVVPIGMTYISPSLRVEYANPAIKQYHDFNSGLELIGKTLDQIFPPHAMDFILPFFNATLNGETVSFLGRADEKGGLVLNDDNFAKTYYFQTTYIPHLAEDDQVLGVIIIIEEITSLKRAELELTEQNAYLERFAHMLAHDLKEPVRTVKTYGDILSSKLVGRINQQETRFLNYMVDSSQRLYSIIEGLRTFNAIGSDELTYGEINLNTILEGAKEDLRLHIQENYAKIDAEALPIVRANSVLMHQLFQNLLSNAIKYSREEVAPQVHFSFEEQETYYLIGIKDNGIGIREEDKEVIFNLFSRLKTNKETTGTGLGLSLCKKIVESHKGKIWVESEVGKGSTFYFTLPKYTVN